MSLKDILTDGSGVCLIVLTVVQLAPIQVNPWTTILRWVGKLLNGEVLDLITLSEVKTARYRILRFDDEIRHKEKHTEEHFNQILEDIDAYEKYCQGHPDYKNSKAVMAINNVKDTYRRCKEENSFLV